MILDTLIIILVVIVAGAAAIQATCYVGTMLTHNIWGSLLDTMRAEVRKQIKEETKKILEESVAEEKTRLLETLKQIETSEKTLKDIQSSLFRDVDRSELPPLGKRL